MPKILHPETMSREETKLLFDFFESQRTLGVRLWSCDKVYTFSNHAAFQFPSMVIERARKDGKTGVRYEFFRKHPYARGGKSTVHQIQGTLALQKETAIYKPYGLKRVSLNKPSEKKRLIKIQEHYDTFPIERVENEYQISRKASHLAIKPPTLIGDTSYTVMREIKGENLFNIILDDSTAISLTIAERLEINQALLKALKEQVTDKGIIHCDIKCENIIIDKGPPISATIFDYGFSSLISDKNPMPSGGTLAYAAPELFNDMKTAKSDVFSLGRVMALLWRVDIFSYLPQTPAQAQRNALNVDLGGLFKGIEHQLSAENMADIKAILAAMLAPKPEDRITLDEAIVAFNDITLPKDAMQMPIVRPLSKITYDECQQRIEHLLKEVTTLEKHVTTLKQKENIYAATKIESFREYLTLQLKELQNMTFAEYKEDGPLIIERCKKRLKNDLPLLQILSHNNYIFTNIALAFAGLGFIYFIGCLLNKAFTGHFLFFTTNPYKSVIEEGLRSIDPRASPPK